MNLGFNLQLYFPALTWKAARQTKMEACMFSTIVRRIEREIYIYTFVYRNDYRAPIPSHRNQFSNLTVSAIIA